MEINLFQINKDKDVNNVMFERYDRLESLETSFDSSIYDLMYHGNVDAKNLEDVYRIFNIAMPTDYCGRSMSVSDVVEVVESSEVNPGFYFCDAVGFREVDFDSSKCSKPKDNTIDVVICEPGKKAYAKTIRSDLESLQGIVGGMIECCYPFRSSELIICNDEGKLNGSELCRGLFDDDGELIDIIAGTFIICGMGEENFKSLTKDKQELYLSKFKNAETFYRVGDKIEVIRVNSN